MMFKARVENLSAEQENHWDLENGQIIEVIALIPGSYGVEIAAVWTDDDGRFRAVPTWALRRLKDHPSWAYDLTTSGYFVPVYPWVDGDA